MSTKVAVGMFLYNEEKHVAKAIEALLHQTYSNFRLVILNDCSSDNTEDIVLGYAKKDERISYFRNERRMGYCANYRITFGLAGDGIDYFAWAAGHDIHQPRWLETMVRALDENPAVVMAYPLTVFISPDTGEVQPDACVMFDSCGLSPKDRIRAICYEAGGFGNMIYGLFRANALRKAGVFPLHLIPDRLLLSQLSLYGPIKQVHEGLWCRRDYARYKAYRPEVQRKIAFANPPWYTFIPWPLAHFAHLTRRKVLHLRRGSLRERYLGLRLALMYLENALSKSGHALSGAYPIIRAFPNQLSKRFSDNTPASKGGSKTNRRGTEKSRQPSKH